MSSPPDGQHHLVHVEEQNHLPKYLTFPHSGSLGVLSFIKIGKILPVEKVGAPYAASTMVQVAAFIILSLIVQNQSMTQKQTLGLCFVGVGIYGTYLLYTGGK